MKRVRAIVLALLLVGSVFAGIVPATEPAAAKPPGFVDVPGKNVQKSEVVVDPGRPPKKSLPKQARSGKGPPEFVQEKLAKVPGEATENVLVSDDANTTLVDIAVTKNRRVAMVVTDDVSDDGRTVAIGTNVLLRTLGEKPAFATVTHESGDSVVKSINYSDGYASINLSHFSTNTVTFSGEVHLTGDPAVDGTSYTYGIQDLNAVGSYSINLTGATAYERENQSGQVGDGGTIPLSIAGTADPVGPNGEASPDVVLEGVETTKYFSSSGGPVTAGDSNTVTFDGNQPPTNPNITFEGRRSENARTVSLTGASDGSTKDYSVGGNLLAENEKVTFTGVQTSGSQTTDSGTDGGTIDPAGNIDPTGPSGNNEPEITFKGQESSTQDDYSGTGLSPSATESISVEGNLQPTDGSGGDPLLEITHYPSSTYNIMDTNGDGSSENSFNVFDDNGPNTEIGFEAQESGEISQIVLQRTNSYGYDGAPDTDADIYIVQESTDGDKTDGTLVKSGYNYSWSGDAVINLDTKYSVTSGTVYSIGVITSGYGSDNWFSIGEDTSGAAYDSSLKDVDYTVQGTATDVSVADGTGTSVSYGDFSYGETKSKHIGLTTSSSSLDFSGTSSGAMDYSLTMQENYATEDPGVDIDGDGTNEATASGILTSGQTSTVELAPLDETSQTVDTKARTAGPAPDWDITYSPKYATEDPAVDLDGDGTDEASYSGQLSEGATHMVSVDGLEDGISYTASTSLTAGNVDWDLTFTEVTGSKDPAVDVDGDSTNEATYVGVLDSGQTATESISSGLTTGSNTLTFDGSGTAYNYTLEATEVYHTEDPDVDVDGDGTYEVTYTGILSPGSTASYDVPDLTLTSSELAAATNGGSEVIAEAQYREVTETKNVTVSVNGNETGYDLSLDDGNTTSLNVNESWIVNGTNTVEISVSPSVSSDAPAGTVGFDYYHTAEDLVETTYAGETWTERYNVSKTWANSKENASVTIPFDSGHVVGIRDLEKSVNGSSRTAIDSANYTLDGTSLTVELGDVAAGEDVRVWANGTKVRVGNGDISVTDPTIEGNELDTEFSIDSRSPGFYLEVSGTDTPDRVHHLETLSWTEPNPYTEHDADGDQYLYLPNSTAGGTARIQTLPLEIEPATGDVHIYLEDDNESHPVFRVEPGDDLGDEVEFGWYNTTSGETYVLDSITSDVARDTKTAESPVWLVDDDSSELLEIYEEDADAGTTDGATDGGTEYISPVSQTRAWYESLPVISIGAALALAIVAAIANYLFEEWWKILGTVGSAALVELVLLTEFIWPDVILSPLATGVREVAPTVGFVLAIVIAYVIYQRWGDIGGGGDEEDPVVVGEGGTLRLRRK